MRFLEREAQASLFFTLNHMENISKAVKVKYKNYRGEIGIRSIVPIEVYWGQTEYHPHDQWLLKVWDVEKCAERVYAFKDIQEFDVK